MNDSTLNKWFDNKNTEKYLHYQPNSQVKDKLIILPSSSPNHHSNISHKINILKHTPHPILRAHQSPSLIF